MEGLFRGVLRHRKAVVGVFVGLAVICGMCIPSVKIDANMSDYLPKSAQSSQDLDLMKQVYGNDITNAWVYVTGISQTDAMVEAMTKSFPVILSSAAVTFFGFLSLAAMQFLIGADMGIALAKGIVCSFFSITLLMPCILYGMRHAVEKTTHAPFIKSFKALANFCHKGAIPAPVIALVLAMPALKASGSVSFTYSASANVAADSQVKLDGNVINDAFGESQTWAILVPQGKWAEENALVEDLKALPTTKSVLSYSTVASSALPYKLAVSSPMIRQVGMLIARGALIGVILIFFVLPLLFTGGDKIVQHTSYQISFYQGEDESHPDGSEPLPTRA